MVMSSVPRMTTSRATGRRGEVQEQGVLHKRPAATRARGRRCGPRSTRAQCDGSDHSQTLRRRRPPLRYRYGRRAGWLPSPLGSSFRCIGRQTWAASTTATRRR
jgi:hypothetical protein